MTQTSISAHGIAYNIDGGRSASLADEVAGVLTDWVDDYDVERLTYDYEQAIQQAWDDLALPYEPQLVGDEIYITVEPNPPHRPLGADKVNTELLVRAVAGVDFWAIAERWDISYA